MKAPVFVLLLMIVSSSLLAQDLRIERGKFYNGQTQVKMRDYIDLLSPNKEAHDLALKASSGYQGGNVLGFVGGFMVGWPLGTAIGGGDPNWALAGGGAGLLAIAFPLQGSAVKKMQEATDIYNQEGLKETTLNFNLGVNGFKLVYSF